MAADAGEIGYPVASFAGLAPVAPLGFMPSYTVYLPVATNQPHGLHGNVTLAGASELISPPSVFTRTRRTATPTDSYEIDVFDPAGVDPSYSTGAVGYISATTIVSTPAGRSLLKTYGWALSIQSLNGGFGTSYYYNPFMFGKSSGIQGRVTFSGANAANIPVTLVREEAGIPTDLSTITTGPDGIYQITSAPTLNTGQKYYVRYRNNSDPSKLYAWYTAYVTSYTAGQRAYAGNFDIANFALGTPNGDLYWPYTFTWTRRSNSPTDSYFLQVFGAGGSSYYHTDLLGYVSSTSLYGTPSGFSSGVGYGWDVIVQSPDYGQGVPFTTYNVTFW